ncbi:MAG: nucleoside deaminase, partial [Cyanobium sp.]
SPNRAPLPCPFEKRHPSQLVRDDAFFMALAYNQAIDAWRSDEVPVGAIVEWGGEVIGAAFNQRDSTRDPTAHAEINAIRQACRAIGSHVLSGAVLYASGECCPMCYSAAYWARIQKVYFASRWSDYADLFDDARIQADLTGPASDRLLAPEPLLRQEALVVWQEFRALAQGARY